jgi:hypothetical protein
MVDLPFNHWLESLKSAVGDKASSQLTGNKILAGCTAVVLPNDSNFVKIESLYPIHF